MGKFEKKWKQAVWQYIMDHSTPTKDGFKITFFVQNEGKFWSKVRARQRGYFKRYDLNVLNERQKEVANRTNKSITREGIRKTRFKQMRRMSKDGSFIQKVRLKTSRVLVRVSRKINPVK